MFYQFRFDILFLFAFIAFLFLNMTFGASNKSEVKTANAAVESHNDNSASNPVVKN
ncbi:MAG: hypothetical protein IKW80_04840 [Thermoguttaceae bacterium]|nr:hypothetical protein [Thermoguttaceae bacterium]